MKVEKILQKFFRGYAVLEEVQSPINGKIQIREDWFGGRNLVVGGITQSGGAVEKVWRLALRGIRNKELGIRNCLILGLGAGTAAKLVSKQWPEVKIIGIEIDPEMVKLGRKHFNLDKTKNLEIRLGDATSYSNDLYHDNKFDLILMDLYLGDEVPKGAETEEFLENIKKCLTDNGIAIFNRLYYANKKEKTDKFGEKLKKIFTKIEAKKVATNKLFLCQR